MKETSAVVCKQFTCYRITSGVKIKLVQHKSIPMSTSWCLKFSGNYVQSPQHNCLSSLLESLLLPSSEMSTLAPGFSEFEVIFFCHFIQSFQQLTSIHQNWKYCIIAVFNCTIRKNCPVFTYGGKFYLFAQVSRSTFHVFDLH